jgi:hypothetical protein
MVSPLALIHTDLKFFLFSERCSFMYLTCARSSVFISLFVGLIFCAGGCGGKTDQATSGGTIVHTEAALNDHIKLLETPPNDTETEDSGTYEKRKRVAINLIGVGGASSKAAIPALEKFRDSTENPRLKQLAVDALARIQK